MGIHFQFFLLLLIVNSMQASFVGLEDPEEVVADPFHRLYRRLYYAAFLIDEQIALMERLMLNATKRNEDFRGYWKDEEPEVKKINMMVLENYGDVIRERVRGFLEVGRSVIETCFNTTTFDDEVDPVLVKEISEIRIKNKVDTRKFFLYEMPRRLQKSITDPSIVNTTHAMTEPSVTAETIFNTTSTARVASTNSTISAV